MGLFNTTLNDIKDKYTLDVESQKENAMSLIIGNRGITNYRTNMEKIGIRGGVLTASLENGFFESNLKNNPININYKYYKPEVKEPIEGINFSQTSDSLLLGTPYAYHERPLKNKTNLPLGEIDFLKKGDDREIWTIESKQHDNAKIKGILNDFNQRFKKDLYSVNSENDFYEELGYDRSENHYSEGTSQDSQKTVLYNGSNPNKKNILTKTQELFAGGQIHSMISRFYDIDENTGEKISRGRNLTKKGGPTKDGGYENPYCRVWTAKHQYSKLQDLMRSYNDENDIRSSFKWENLRPNNGSKLLKKYSVLNSEGFVKITPNRTENDSDLKRYMFSIENLAWRDVIKKEGILSKEQIGPNQGRIMWFPPYNLKFTENINVDWNQNEFIGRGEKIYTYKNTERNGTLSFTLLIDHPSLLNKWNAAQTNSNKDEIDEEILRFFAGCSNFEDSPSEETIEETPNKEDNKEPLTANPKPKNDIEKRSLFLFFPNNFSGIDYKNKTAKEIIEAFKGYERSDSGEIEITDNAYSDELLKEKNKKDKNEYNLNNFGDISSLDDFVKAKILEVFSSEKDSRRIASLLYSEIIDRFADVLEGKKVKINISGYASSHGNAQNNAKLASNRGKIASVILEGLLKNSTISYDKDFTYNSGIIPVNGDNVNDLEAKLARCAVITFTTVNNNKEVSNSISGETLFNISNDDLIVEKENTGSSVKQVVSKKRDEEYTYDNEYLYFEKIKDKDPIYYKAITDKIKYFSPAYHSITPEGFNARLTFLHQCTRQGPTYSGSDGKSNGTSSNYLKYAGNLAFGRAPYCILRIGDFFYTKICIDSISIDYNNGDGVQWDLNPEGAGVQPMMANVNVNFKFLGGQDISGPVERLQNAVTANYYANASVYDRHADNESHYYDAWDNDKNNDGRKEIRNK